MQTEPPRPWNRSFPTVPARDVTRDARTRHLIRSPSVRLSQRSPNQTPVRNPGFIPSSTSSLTCPWLEQIILADDVTRPKLGRKTPPVVSNEVTSVSNGWESSQTHSGRGRIINLSLVLDLLLSLVILILIPPAHQQRPSMISRLDTLSGVLLKSSDVSRPNWTFTPIRTTLSRFHHPNNPESPV